MPVELVSSQTNNVDYSVSQTCQGESEQVVFECLQAAVFIAKEYEVQRVSRLKVMLEGRGFQESIIKQALVLWAKAANNS